MNIFALRREQAMEAASRMPGRGKDMTFGESIESAMTRMFETENSDRRATVRAQVISDYLDEVYRKTGRRFVDEGMAAQEPDEAASPWSAAANQSVRRAIETRNQFSPQDMISDRIDQYIAGNPKAGIAPMPRGADLESLVDQKLALLFSEARINEARENGLGAFIGGTIGAMRDPINIATMALGAGATSGILRTALVEGALGAASQGAVTGLNFDERKRLDPQYQASDAADEILMAAFGGVVLGGGMKALGRAIEILDRPKLSREVNDAINVVQRDTLLSEGNPIPAPTVMEVQVHRAVLADGLQAIDEGRAPDIPDRSAEVAARLAGMDEAPEVPLVARPQELAPEDFEALVTTRARALAPEVMARADALDDDITQARGTIATLRAREQDVFAAAVSRSDARIAELETKLATFTGKRRTSPKAKALREEIDRERQSGGMDAVTDEEIARIRSDVAMLRLRIVEKQSDRGRLGPEVAAVRRQAEIEVGIGAAKPDGSLAKPIPIEEVKDFNSLLRHVVAKEAGEVEVAPRADGPPSPQSERVAGSIENGVVKERLDKIAAGTALTQAEQDAALFQGGARAVEALKDESMIKIMKDANMPDYLDVLDEADEMEAAAKEIAACALGVAA